MVLNHGKSSVSHGALFEEVFKTLLDAHGFIEGEDYIKAKSPSPDFFFKKSKTYIEIKFRSNGKVSYSKKQEKKFKQLINEGYKVKVVCFNVEVIEPFENIVSVNNLLNTLNQKKV